MWARADMQITSLCSWPARPRPRLRSTHLRHSHTRAYIAVLKVRFRTGNTSPNIRSHASLVSHSLPLHSVTSQQTARAPTLHLLSPVSPLLRGAHTDGHALFLSLSLSSSVSLVRSPIPLCPALVHRHHPPPQPPPPQPPPPLFLSFPHAATSIERPITDLSSSSLSFFSSSMSLPVSRCVW